MSPIRISLIAKVLVMVTVTFAGTLYFVFTHHMERTKESFKASEREKAQIILQTLMPLVSINESFGFDGSIDEQIKDLKSHNPAIIDIIIQKDGSVQPPVEKGNYIVEHAVIRDYFDASRQVGTISIIYSNLHYEQLMQTYKEDILLSSAIVAMVLIFLSALLYYAFQPLRRLAKVVNRYDFTEKSDPLLETITCNDEVGDIGLALRELMERMHDYTAQLGAMNETLQEKVDAQTAELLRFNRDLQGRIDSAVEKIRIQDAAMIRQSRHAAMGEMIGNIAHQWKQPLNTLGAIIQDMRDAAYHGELDLNYADQVVKNAMSQIHGMAQTIEDFRNFFRPEKLRSHFSVREAVDYACRMTESEIRRNGIFIDIIGGDEQQIYGLKNELAQVFINIFNNAKDAFVDNAIRNGAVIRVETTEDQKSVTVRVSDNGGGIPESILPQVFDPYFTTKDEDKGTGVGLYMSRMIVESMGGRMEAANDGAGAVFTVTLPKG